MATYRVRFYQHTYSPDRHSIKRLVHQVDVEADGPSQALIQAEAGLQGDLEADSVEVAAHPHYGCGCGCEPRAA